MTFFKYLVLSILFMTLLFANNENNSTKPINPLLEKFDTNKDGQIYYREASKALQEHFCQYDIDQDAYLNSQEIKDVPLSFAEDKIEP